MRLRLMQRFFLPGVFGYCLAVSSAIAADQPVRSAVHLTNDDFLPGQLRGSEDPKVLRWHSPYFTKPFEFSLNAVNAVHYPVPAAQPKPTGDYCFELVSGDVLYGNLVGLTDE